MALTTRLPHLPVPIHLDVRFQPRVNITMCRLYTVITVRQLLERPGAYQRLSLIASCARYISPKKKI